MINKIKKILVISILIIVYITINLIYGNKTFAVEQSFSTDINSVDSKKYPQIKELIQALQKEHPNWKFKILYTDINWSDAIANEYVGHGLSPRNLVPANNANYDKEWVCKACGTEETYDSGKWYCASEAAIAYMMDVRNSLNNADIFQLLELSYSECSKEKLKKMTTNTFLNNDSYINAILDAAKKYNVNAYYIVARILQEQGRNGSTLSQGQGYNGQYVGYYNVFNIGASGKGKDNVILNGLKKAQDNDWTTLEKSIIGGTEIIAKSYIARGQNTLYLQKFDVDNSDGNLYWHQYMQNLVAAQKEGQTLKKTFSDMDSIEGEYTFIVPVFKNMPETAINRPSTTNTELPSNADLVRVNVTGSLYLRDKPQKDANKIGSIYKDNIVTRLEKATEKVDGTYWDYIMTASGVKGYAARETFDYEERYKLYLVPVNPDISDEEDPSIIKNDKVKIDTKTNSVTTIPGATVKDFSDLLGKEVIVKNAKNETLTKDSKLSTGCVIDDTYTVAVLGDVNGDGEVKSTDYMAIKNAIMGTKELSDLAKIAADVNNDGNIKSTDYMKIKNYIMGNTEIKL